MATPSHERAIYLPAGAPCTFCVAHESGTDPTGLGILLCAPFGWDDMASYRSRRFWAVRFAAEGHAVLRFDLPGSGDSAGSPTDPALLDVWCAAVTHGEAWLRAAGCTRVAVIGLGIGGLIALRALELGAAFEDLVTWGTPADGRTAVRELRALSRLQSNKLAGGEQALPDGWLEVGGHVLSAATSSELLALDPAALSVPSLQRALILEREDTPGDLRLAESLSGLGVTVTSAPGPGYAALVSHPQTSHDPAGVLSTVSGWLTGSGVLPRRGDRGDAQPAPSAPKLHLRGDGVAEVPVTIAHHAETMQGILATPGGAPRGDLGAVFFNAGALRRAGPNRLWVETARSWASTGTPVLRLDLVGIGDSGLRQGPLPTPRLYVPDLLDQAHAAVEWMLRSSQVKRVVVVGLCSGGHLAFHVASRERRVCAAVLINPTALVWDRNVELPWHPGPRRLLSRSHLRSGPSPARSLPGSLARWAVSALRRELTFLLTRRAIERELDALRAADTRVVLALCEREPEQLRLTLPRHRTRLRRWPNVKHVTLPGTDHTLRPIPAQRKMRQILGEVLSREIARVDRTM